jgi:two-component system response regulator NreC
MQQEPAHAREAFSVGAAGYVLKQAADGELVAAVRRAAAGEQYLNPRLGARIAAEPPTAHPDDLSEREVDVLRLIARGHTTNALDHHLVDTWGPHLRDRTRAIGVLPRPISVVYPLPGGSSEG